MLLRLKDREATGASTLILVTLAAALAYLSHSSNAFALLPLAIAFVPTILRCGTLSILIATAAGIVCVSPWLWWQGFVQPHGNALVRFPLAQDFGFDNRASSISTSIYLAYQKLGWDGWIGSKLDGLRLLLGLRDDWKSFGDVALQKMAASTWGAWRVLDFFSLTRSLGVVVIGLSLLVVNMILRSGVRQPFPIKAAAAIGLSGILLASVIMLPPPITHQQAYGSILFLFCAGAMTLSRSASFIRHGAFVVALLYWLIVWIVDPLQNALRVDFLAVIMFSAGSIWVILLWPQVGRRLVFAKA
jgi:hypothetical protein